MIYYINTDTDLAACNPGNGDTILFKSGATFSAAALPLALLEHDNLTLGVSGTGAKPIITGGIFRSDWTYDAANNVYSRPAYSSNILGNVEEDGVQMKSILWMGSIAATAPNMVSGYNAPYWAGSMTYDPTNFILYIRPSVGSVTGHQYQVSESLYIADPFVANVGLTMDGLVLRQASRHGLRLRNKRNVKLTNLETHSHGGRWETTYFIGNGVEISGGCYGLECYDFYAKDIYDSPISPQLYSSTPNGLSGHHYRNITVERWGMHGFEITSQTADNLIRDVWVENLVSRDGGLGFSGDRLGATFSCVVNNGSTHPWREPPITNCYAIGVSSTNSRRLYLGSNHGGSCGIINAVGTGSRLPAKSDKSATPAGSTQWDFVSNVTDDGGAFVGGILTSTSTMVSELYGTYSKTIPR